MNARRSAPTVEELLEGAVLPDDADLRTSLEEALKARDLRRAAAVYGAIAGYNGDNGCLWERWYRLVEGRGSVEVLAEAGEQALRWFAVWAMQHGQGGAGLGVYRAYLRMPKKLGLFDGDKILFLLTLLDRGELTELVQTAGHLASIQESCADVRLIRGAAMAQQEGFPHPSLTPTSADESLHQTTRAVATYLRWSRGEKTPEVAMLAQALLQDAIYRELRPRLQAIADSFPGLARTTKAKPARERPRRPLPAYVCLPSTRVTKSIFGGDRWETTCCLGCGHPIRVWFSIDFNTVDKTIAASLHEAPLLSCPDCLFWMGAHQYELSGRTAKLLAVDIEPKAEYRRAHGTARAPERQFVTLKRLSKDSWPKLSSRFEPTVILGDPPRPPPLGAPKCFRCSQPMTYYGALGQSEGFVGQPTLLNGGGYLLHFLCPACLTIVAVPNWM